MASSTPSSRKIQSAMPFRAIVVLALLIYSLFPTLSGPMVVAAKSMRQTSHVHAHKSIKSGGTMVPGLSAKADRLRLTATHQTRLKDRECRRLRPFSMSNAQQASSHRAVRQLPDRPTIAGSNSAQSNSQTSATPSPNCPVNSFAVTQASALAGSSPSSGSPSAVSDSPGTTVTSSALAGSTAESVPAVTEQGAPRTGSSSSASNPASQANSNATSSGAALTRAPVAAPVPTSIRIFATPVLEARKSAWMSLYDCEGQVKAGQRVSINGAIVAADDCGILSFTVPDSDKLHISVINSEGNETTARIDYSLRTNGLLVQESSVATAFEKLEELSSAEAGPRILYAPAVVDKRSSFLVVGKNFSGGSGKDRVSIDGRDADLFAGSSVCMLARAPEKSSLGPLKELFVMADGEASNSREMDICRIDSVRRDADDGNKSQVRVVVCGTNMPCIVELSAGNAAKLKLKGRSVGATATVVSPGGDQNHMTFEVEGPTASPLNAVLLADPLLEPALISNDSPNLTRLAVELDKAQACRLHRRYIALDLRLTDSQTRREHLLSSPSPDANEVDLLHNEIRALSLRKDRVNKMIAAQRAIIEGTGGTTEDFNNAVALAEAGASFDLEAALKPFDLFPKSMTVAIATERKRRKPVTPGETGNQESFPSAGEHVRAPMLPNAYAAMRKDIHTLTALAPKCPRMIAPPAPYVPDMQDLESYMVASYMGPPPPAPLKMVPVTVHSPNTPRKQINHNTSPSLQGKRASKKAPATRAGRRHHKRK